MDYINLVEGYIYCINQTGVTKAGFYFLMVLVFYALFSNTLAVRPHSFQKPNGVKTNFVPNLQIVLLIKVPFHPMVKIFSLCERICVLMSCCLTEIPRSVFYYTSCQPNWTKLISIVKSTGHGDFIKILLSDDNLGSNKSAHGGNMLDNIFVLPTFNCTVLEKPSILLNTGAIVFFTMTCFFRYYLIVIKQGSPNGDKFTSSTEILKFTILGFAITTSLFALTLDDQYTFSRACLTPLQQQPASRLSKSIYYSILVLNNNVVLILYIIIIFKITKVPSAPSNSQVPS